MLTPIQTSETTDQSMDSEEKRWCQQAREGDANAASQLIDLYYEDVYAYFRRLCGNAEDASDLTQKTFCKFWDSLPSFAGKSSLKTWLFGIAYHGFVDWVRVLRRPPLPDRWWEDQAHVVTWPDQSLQAKESAEKVFYAVEHLEPGDRQLVHLHFYQGLSVQETADVLKVPLSTTKYRLNAALDKLRSTLTNPSPL